MIIYATQKTRERLVLQTVNELSLPLRIFAQEVLKEGKGNELLEWGAKMFYFGGKKCVQLVNFASRLTLFIFNVTVNGVLDLGNRIADNIKALYKNKPNVIEKIEKMFEQHPAVCFEKLTNKSMITILNNNLLAFDDRFYASFFPDKKVNPIKMTHFVNFNFPQKVTINGAREYVMSGEYFEELLLKSF